MRKYVMVLKTNNQYTDEKLTTLKEDLNKALEKVLIAKIINIKPDEEVQLLELITE